MNRNAAPGLQEVPDARQPRRAGGRLHHRRGVRGARQGVHRDLITPIIALIIGEPNFGALHFTINHSQFAYGDFLNNLVTFITTAAVVFFFVVKPYNALMARRATEDPDTKECPECTSAIPIKARRCPQCTAQLAASA